LHPPARTKIVRRRATRNGSPWRTGVIITVSCHSTGVVLKNFKKIFSETTTLGAYGVLFSNLWRKLEPLPDTRDSFVGLRGETWAVHFWLFSSRAYNPYSFLSNVLVARTLSGETARRDPINIFDYHDYHLDYVSVAKALLFVDDLHFMDRPSMMFNMGARR